MMQVEAEKHLFLGAMILLQIGECSNLSGVAVRAR